MGWEQPHLACSEELPLAAAPAGYQLIFQEAIPALAARELLVLQVLLAGGLETECESIQVSGTIGLFTRILVHRGLLIRFADVLVTFELIRSILRANVELFHGWRHSQGEVMLLKRAGACAH